MFFPPRSHRASIGAVPVLGGCQSHNVSSWWRAASWSLALLAAQANAAIFEPAAPGDAPPIVISGDSRIGIAVAGDQTFILRPPADRSNVIVEFRSPPALAMRNVPSGVAAAQREHVSMAADLGRFRADLGASGQYVMRREFRECFNGIALTATPAMIDRIRSLPYVQAVFPDDSVHAALQESVSLIGADRVWSQYGITGQGVVVGIIDTGIDYNDVALGGGFGPGFRVEAGWDFVNNDGDPMDDNLHGTHVAGIVGANGAGLRGVAPDVHFRAYKVLDQFGSGTEADVIAAIEQAVDPDQNPLTRDGVNVMNLSLSGPGDAQAPLSQAVDVASEAGVVCVVAAGNSGRYLSIGTPAAAAQAISVGATDLQDRIAYFSSRGPLPGSYVLKPDVVAPGVDITSCIPGGREKTLSGTSMAAPHVSGAAALLLQGHPDWTPRQVKAALMNTAVRAQGGATERGAGRIDVPAAIAPQFLIVPSSFSFPRPPPEGAPSSDTRPFVVTNVSTQQQTVTLSVDARPWTGMQATVEPASLTIAAGDSASATLTLTIDPTTFAYPDTLPFYVEGDVVVRSADSQHRVPFGLIRAIEVSLEGPETPDFALIHDGLRRHWTWIPSQGTPLAILRPGRYDLVSAFLPAADSVTALVVREGTLLSRDQALSVRKDEATLPISIEPVDENGQPFTVDLAEVTVMVDRVFTVRVPALSGRLRSTPLTDAYRLEWDHFQYSPGNSFYDLRGGSQGLSGPTVFRNAPGDLHRFPVTIRTDPDVLKSAYHYRWLRFGSQIFGFQYAFGLAGDLVEIANVIPHDPRSQSLGFSKRVARSVSSNPFIDPVAFTPIVDVIGPDQVTGGPDFNPNHQIFASKAQGFHMDVDEGPPLWIGKLSFGPTQLYLSAQLPLLRYRLFTSPLGGISDGGDPRFWIFEQGVAVDSGTIVGAGLAMPAPGEFRHALLGPGPHRLVVEAPPYVLGGDTGRVRVECDFAPGPNDSSLPYIRRFELLADGVQSDSIAFDHVTSAQLRLDAWDDTHLSRVSAWLAPSGTNDWQALGSGTDSSLVLALPDTLNGLVAIRVEAVDAAGNQLTYTADPAYHSSARLVAVVRAAQVEASASFVTLHWQLPAGANGTFPVYRRGIHTEWAAIGSTAPESGDRARFEDHDIASGRRYEYAIGVPSPSGEVRTGSVWVDVPGARPALFGILPNPGPGNLRVSFSLGSNAPATLELVDVSGRRLRRTEVGPLGAGEHSMDLGEGLRVPAGIYWIRLQQSGVTQVMRAAVIR